jgi:hypothetical protein
MAGSASTASTRLPVACCATPQRSRCAPEAGGRVSLLTEAFEAPGF